jgi:flagellar M-ring protein FliF
LEKPLENILALWRTLDFRKRAIIVGATVAVFFAVYGLTRVSTAPNMALLYAGLESAAAGEVVAALEKTGSAFEVRGDSIFVDASARDSLRMTLATEGLPSNSGTGYELLNELSAFGTTSQMFDAAYWRAKEGELARTIMSSPQIREARVHIAQAPSQPFQRDLKPTASVSLMSRTGISAEQARGLRHLIAASVPGMMSQDVTVIDASTGLISADIEASGPTVAANTKADEIKRNVERILAARVGAGKSVVEVTVDVVTVSESITEQVFDPQGRVAISSETEQRSGKAEGQGGAVTVASNLPQGDTAQDGGPKNENNETSERINYEVSQTQREVVKVPGDIRRISLAVLIDGITATAADGTQTSQARPEAELATLSELVSSAAGLDTTRGDVLTIKSMAFEPIALPAQSVETAGIGAFLGPVDLMELIKLTVLSAVLLVLGLFVIRPILTSNQRSTSSIALAPPPLALTNGAPTERSLNVLTGEIDDYSRPTSLSGEVIGTIGDMDPVARLKLLIDQRQNESIEVLRGWMQQDEEQQA